MTGSKPNGKNAPENWKKNTKKNVENTQKNGERKIEKNAENTQKNGERKIEKNVKNIKPNITNAKKINKIIVIVNGKGGVGKSTACKMMEEYWLTHNRSSIDPIKDMATKKGYTGAKTKKWREKLAKLKQDNIDLAHKYCIIQAQSFMETSAKIMFLHIREPDQIERFKKWADCQLPCYTVLFRRGVMDDYGNPADDGVFDYHYDYIIDNIGTIADLKASFKAILDKMIGFK